MKRTAKLQDIVEIQRRGLARFLFEAEGNEKETEEVEPAEETSAEEANAEEAEEDKPEKPAEPVKTDNVKVAIDDLLMSAEEKALKSAAIEQTAEKAKGIGGVAESRRLRSIRPLYEEAGQLMPQIDIRVFAGEVARLARNYRFLLDMERLIVTQAKDYLASKYDESAAEELEEILNDEYDIDVKRTPGKPEGKLGVPNAAGARQAGA
jgi:hypothetical protein